ncbi:hypothetical protein H8N00_14320 [Streptomyces sp. AC563]|uniref:hypothetical protein n=1 Tax=Streptomyces buecherae TaxID=2763006 RepID=UPI001A1F57EF|nr:hypothetical protein [Streptomyces buecherae]MBC3990031.1 hypothetical protein [Streptomyces buecherae]
MSARAGRPDGERREAPGTTGFDREDEIDGAVGARELASRVDPATQAGPAPVEAAWTRAGPAPVVTA